MLLHSYQWSSPPAYWDSVNIRQINNKSKFTQPPEYDLLGFPCLRVDANWATSISACEYGSILVDAIPGEAFPNNPDPLTLPLDYFLQLFTALPKDTLVCCMN